MILFPTKYVGITQYFSAKHRGIDLGWNSKIEGCGSNQPVYAPASGVVIASKDNDKTKKSWGNYVKIKHDDETFTLCAHLKEGIKVKNGDKVEAMQLIGYMGATGDAKGNHVHFEVYKGGSGTNYRVNPLEFAYATSFNIIASGDKDKVKYIDNKDILVAIIENIKDGLIAIVENIKELEDIIKNG